MIVYILVTKIKLASILHSVAFFREKAKMDCVKTTACGSVRGRLVTLAAAFLAMGLPLGANPTGGEVAAGSATIASAGTTETITQSTQQAIINWQQFSIASNEATKFFVPNSSSATLNRVLGGNPSAIYGSLSSNGQLIVINPNGIVVGPSGRIDTAGFIGSTLAISDDDFLKGGNLNFSGNGSATVDNEGTIHAETGDVYLIGGQVTNGGTISATKGTAGLAAGSDILFEQAGDQHLYVQATPLTATRAVGVTNSGTIHAAAAELKAAGGNAYALAINNTGQITATGFKKVHGQVLLTADGGNIDNGGTIVAHNANGSGGKIVLNGHGTSASGTVLSSGKLIATGRKAGTKGGTVEVLGNQVGITGSGLVDVSGEAGGGTALIGGDEHGANAAIPDADQTYLGPNATIKADALTLGDGGKVILWGNETTQAYGAISVRGGAQGGNGGLVETSGKTLDARTVPDLAAPHGQGGTWLLDPSDITIGDTVETTDGFSEPFTITSGSTYDLSQDDLAAALQDGNVTLDASTGTGTGGGTITWTDSSETFAPALNQATTLTLNAPGGISINNVIMSPKGSALNLVLNATIDGAGPVQINNSSLTTKGGSFTANGNGVTGRSGFDETVNGISISNSTIDAQGGDITLTGNGGYGSQDEEGVGNGNGVYIGGGEAFTDLIQTTGTGNITIKAVVNNDITSTGFGTTAFNLYGGGAESESSAAIRVASGLLSITGNVTAGTQETLDNSGGVTGVYIGGGAQVQATAAGGSVTISGDVSGSTVVVDSSATNGAGSTGVEIDNFNGGGTTVSVIGSNEGVGGVLNITGTAGTLDTSDSVISGDNLPYTEGVDINNGATLSAGDHATITLTGTGGAVVTSQDPENVLAGDYTGGSEGVEVDGASITMGTYGTLTVLGQGGAVNAGYGANAGDANSQGVGFDAGSGATTVSLGDGGSITLTGYGGTIDNSHAEMVTGKDQPSTQGVSVDSGAQITAGGSTTIGITGTAGNITSGENTDGDAIGVNIGSGDDTEGGPDTLVSSESGNITIMGYGGLTPNLGLGAEAHGFDGHSTTIETTAGGSITMIGVGGGGYAGDGTVSGSSVPNSGVALIDDITLQTSGAGSISLTGWGGVGSTGVVVEELTNDDVLDSSPALPVVQSGGALTINALNGTGEYLNGTFTAASVAIGTEFVPGTPGTITSGNLTIVDSTFTVGTGTATGTGITEDASLVTISTGTGTGTGTGSGGDFTAYGAGYVSATDANGDPDGIEIDGSTINTQGGSITLVGVGGHTYTEAGYLDGIGVNLEADNNASTTLETTGSGNITITASAGSADVASNNGAFAFFDYASGNQIDVSNGTVSIKGTVAGSADGTDENAASIVGVEVGGGAQIAATGSGNITLTGDISAATSTVTGSEFSFADGIEIGSNATVSVNGGLLTLQGTGTSIDASGYDGGDRVFSAGVQLDDSSALNAGTDGQISVTGTIKSGAVGNSADLIGTLITLDSTVSGGDGAQVSLTGNTTGSNVISSAGGNTNVGLEIDDPVKSISEVAEVSESAPETTSVTVGASGMLTLQGTSGSVDASLNSDQSNQAGTAGIDIDGGSQITAGLGTTVTVTGTGGAATTTTSLTGLSGGVVADDAVLTFDGNNVVSITGTGGTADNGTNIASNTSNPAQSVGVEFENGSDSLLSLGTGGSLTIYGYGGQVSAVNASASATGDTFTESLGIGIHSDVEATGNATIDLHGFGGSIQAGPLVDGVSFGVDIGGDTHPVTLSTESGSLTIAGTAGSAPNLGIGVAIHGFNQNQALIQTGGGALTITGIGAAGNSGPGTFLGFFEPNYGVAAVDDVAIKTTAGGPVSITGTDGMGDVNGGGVAFTTTGDTSVDPDPVQPDINAAGAVTINALSGGGIVLATMTVEAPSVQIGSANVAGPVVTVTSGPVRLLDVDFTLTGPLTVYGAGGGTLSDAVDIESSTLNAGTGDIAITATGGLSNPVGLDVTGSTLETSGAGTITLSGAIAGTRTGSAVMGVDLFDSTLTTETGAISVTGRVSSGNDAQTIIGLDITGGLISATQDGGSVTLVGNTSGATGLDASNVGLALDGDVSTQDGAGISATGTSGGASFDGGFTAGAAVTDGVTVSANLTTTGSAPITITGYGGNIVDQTAVTTSLQSTGADFYSASGTKTISTDAGTITITGTGGTSDNAGFGVDMFAFSSSPFTIQSNSGDLVIQGAAGASPTLESRTSSATYEPNIGVAMGDAIDLSTGGAISITGQGIPLAPDEGTVGSGIAIKIDSFRGYRDGTGFADSEPTTPQLAAGNGKTISLTSIIGTIEVDQDNGTSGPALSGDFVVSAPSEPDFSFLGNMTGSVTLENGGNFVLTLDGSLKVQTGTGDAGDIEIFDPAGIQLGPITAGYLALDSYAAGITQSDALTVSELVVDESSSVTLLNPGNNISILDAISSTGAVSIYTDPGLLLTDSVTSGGPVLIESIGGGLTLGANASVTTTGPGNITLVTDQAFVNDSTAGPDALSASDGVYHIYAGNAAMTNLGGLPVAFTQYNTTYPAGTTQPGNGLFYAGDGTNSGGDGSGTGNGGTPPYTSGGGTALPPVVAAPTPPPPVFTNPYNGGQPPAYFFSGNGDFSQSGSQSGGLAFSSGNGGQVGAGDAAQLNNGQMNNVSNPHASGELNDALSGAVHDSLVDALTSVGAFADSETYGDTSDDEKKKKDSDEQIIGDGGVVEIGDGGVKQIPLSSAPKPLQDALGSGVMHGLQPAGH